MSAMPNTMKIGMGVAFVGAIIAFASMAYAWDGTVECTPCVGINMVVSMVFFAVAGCFSSYSPVKGSTVIVLSALTVAFTVIAAIYGAMMPILAIILVILGILCVAIGSMGSTKNYVDTNRVI
ncbi:MAG: hypothetical protein IKP04_03665 [Candidatus Methanomethylophilaceae archaeon]|nr:hypothetical protein [Candidatus Methanomethylophilaceae archaeon]